MSSKHTMTAVGAALLASVSLMATVAPAASATPVTGHSSKAARSATTITSPLIAGGSLFIANYSSGLTVKSTKQPTFAQALAGLTSNFTYPAPGHTGSIATGGLCVTLPVPSAANAVSLASCDGDAAQTFSTRAEGSGVNFVNADGRALTQVGASDTNVWLGAGDIGSTFVAFAIEDTTVNRVSRVATVSGHGIPGQALILNDDVQVVVDTDGTWSAQVPDMQLGVNRIKVEAWTGGTLVGTQYANGNIDIAPLSAASSFGSRVTDKTTVSGTAQPGATVIVRDSGGTEKGRATADSAGRYSIPIDAPDMAGVATYAVTQVVSNLETAPTPLNVDFGAELAIASPVDDLIVSNGSLAFSGTGAFGAQVTVQEKGSLGVLGSATVLANGRWQIPAISVDKFEHEFVVTQTAPGNNVTSQSVTINPGVSNVVAPTATVTVPTDVTQQASIGGDGTTGATIAVTSDGRQIGSPVTVANGKWSMPIPSSIGAGNHSFTVTQTVDGKAAGTATATRDFGAPVTATSALAGSTATISGAGANGARVVVTESGAQVGTATVTNGAYSIPVTGVTTGDHTYTVTQTAPGNIVTAATTTASRASAITVTNPANPAAGYTPNTAFTFTGTAPRTAGTLTIRNMKGTLIATVPVNPTTGAWSWTRTDMGTLTWKLAFITGEGTADEENFTLPAFAPNSDVQPALDLRVLNPANPAAGYAPNMPFTFSGVAKKTAGTLTIRNMKGTLIATVPVNPTTGAWSWTRSDMGTLTWKLAFITGEGTPNEEKVTLGDFAPNATQALTFTNPADPTTGYIANTAFTFRGTALPNAKITLTNMKGTLLANVTADASGNWEWTRADMGTYLWKITATADAGTAREQTTTLSDFAPRP